MCLLLYCGLSLPADDMPVAGADWQRRHTWIPAQSPRDRFAGHFFQRASL